MAEPRTVVCFGDSNTWGSPPFVNVSQPPGRMPMALRWPRIMAASIGNIHVVEEGLSGRTTVYDDAIEGVYKNGSRTVLAVLESHAPLDVFVIMLGGADFKVQFSATSYNSARGVLTLVQMIKGYYALSEASPDILIVTPPAITADAEPAFWLGADRRCEGHDYYLAQVAERTGCFHFDANRVARASSDGVHLDADGHRALGVALGAEVGAILKMREAGRREPFTS